MCRDRSGGSIGLASVMAFLGEGAKVMMVGHNEENLIKAVKVLKAPSDSYTICKANVADSQDTQNYINKTVAKWGKIDVLFSHAGISGVVKPVTEYPEEIFDRVMAVNIRGSFLACKYGIPQMNDGAVLLLPAALWGLWRILE
jgi:NADP-dependent 3-hydroxy acid dehydrogenase YdfG